MSRSRKKTPGYCDSNPFIKTYYSRCVRRSNKLAIHKDHESYDYLPSGGTYKKANCPWDICDWKWLHYSEQELLVHLEEDYASLRYKYASK